MVSIFATSDVDSSLFVTWLPKALDIFHFSHRALATARSRYGLLSGTTIFSKVVITCPGTETVLHMSLI